ncbi:MAG: hypothetical protein H6765_04855 [Candidatus Peribacteria bacterium]|nr:MAG: hypothetical protein H6765_04855 [Candidatus Peribacteria bacterium]
MQIVLSKDAASGLYFVTDSKLQQMSFHDDLYAMIRRIGKSQLEECTFLLDESYFQFVSFSVHLQLQEELSKAKLNQLIVQKIQELKSQQGISSPYIHHYVSDMVVNGVPSRFVIGKSGKIDFQLHLYFLATDAVTSFEVIAGEICCCLTRY